MPTKVLLYPYKMGSQSARDIRRSTGWKLIRRENSRYRPYRSHTIVNWGCGTTPDFAPAKVLNHPASVRMCANKLQFFRAIDPELVPAYTTNIEVARAWISEGFKVCCRTTLTGHSGQGLVLAETEAQLVNAPLYTKYFPKKQEYRVHVYKSGANAVIFDQQRKARFNGALDEEVNWQIRTHHNGFVFARDGVVLPEVVATCAVRVFNATGLDFGAVDVLYNERHNRAVCVEVNTAPGVCNTTLTNYVAMLRSIV